MALDGDTQQQPNGIEASHSLLTEIIFEILSRLPVDSLLRCRSVCKLWRSLISNPHLTLSTRNNLIFSTSRRTILKTCHLYDNVINALKLDYPFKRPRKSFSIVGSCNGLVCISIEEEDTLFIWNPSTRKSNRIPYNNKMGRVWSAHYGFGYDESTDDYKVVQICLLFKQSFIHDTFVKVYSLTSGSWKDIGVFPCGMPLDSYGKFLNGALHWAANGDLSYGANDATFSAANDAIQISFDWSIISFDLATETYGEVLQPVYDESDDYMDFTLGSLRERLCVLCDNHEDRVDLWVMKVYGVKDSWTKLFSIPYLTDPVGYRFSMPLCISNDGKILFQFGSKLMVYDSNNGSFLQHQHLGKCDQAFTFVESLVSPMPAAGLGDRI